MQKTVVWLQKGLRFLHEMILAGLEQIGLSSVEDFFNQVFFMKYKFMAIYVLVFSLGSGAILSGTFTAWIETWVYAPALTFFMCLSVTVSEWITGIVKAIYVNEEKFDLTKGASIVPKLISQGWALTTAFHFGSSEPLMAWLSTSIAIFLFSFNFLKTLYQVSLLGFLPNELVVFLQDKFKLQNKATHEEADSQS